MRIATRAVLCCVVFLLLRSAADATAAPWKVAGGFSMDFEHLQIEVTPVAKDVYFLHGSGGNILAVVGPEGTLLVDTEFAPVAPKIEAALKGIGAGPVRYVISSHFHSDHTGGNSYFLHKGAVVIAQEQCRARLLVSTFSRYWNEASPAIPEADAPNLTYQHTLTLRFDGSEIVASHVQPAHTDGDTVVYVRPANVVHLGDVFINGLYPFVDVAAKGTIDGYFPVIDDVLSKIDDHTVVVPGHGPVTDRSRLKFYRDMLWTVRNRVAAMVAKGMSLEEIIAANPSNEFDPEWASDRVGPDGFAVMIYQSLTGRRLDWHPSS